MSKLITGLISNMRIAVKEDQNIQKTGETTDADVLFNPIQSIVLDYLGLEGTYPYTEKSPQYLYQPRLTLLGNLVPLYAMQIAHNLLWHLDIEETLEFARENPASLLVEIEIKDPHGQRIRGTPLQILAAAGDRNPRELKVGEKDYGLVEKLRDCFPKGSVDSEKQLTEWFKRDTDKTETRKTMAPYLEEIKTFCQDVIDSKEITDDNPFIASLLELPIVEKFRKALLPDPEHVITSGLLFDLEIFLDFFKVWEANIPKLGGDWESIKSDFFATVVYTTLQTRMQRIDFEIFTTGFINVMQSYTLPKRLDFSAGISHKLVGLGKDFYFAFNGRSFHGSLPTFLGEGIRALGEHGNKSLKEFGAFFKIYIQQKHPLGLCGHSTLVTPAP